MSELKEELTFLKEQETSLSTENKSMSGQLNELRLQVERLNYDNKESIITIDILKEQNQDAKGELEEFKKTIADLKAAQKDTSTEDKEKRKQEKMEYDEIDDVLEENAEDFVRAYVQKGGQ